MEFRGGIQTVPCNSLTKQINGGITMKTLKNIFATRRFCALVLALIMSISMFGSTTVFATETDTSITPHVTVLMHGSTQDYISGTRNFGTFITPDIYTIWGNEVKTITLKVSYTFDDESHLHSGRLIVKKTNGTSVGFTLSEGTNTINIELDRQTTYEVSVIPGCSGKYMCSFNIYY